MTTRNRNKEIGKLCCLVISIACCVVFSNGDNVYNMSVTYKEQLITYWLEHGRLTNFFFYNDHRTVAVKPVRAGQQRCAIHTVMYTRDYRTSV